MLIFFAKVIYPTHRDERGRDPDALPGARPDPHHPAADVGQVGGLDEAQDEPGAAVAGEGVVERLGVEQEAQAVGEAVTGGFKEAGQARSNGFF